MLSSPIRVKLLGHDLQVGRVIASGTTFGFINKPPVRFELFVENVDTALVISFAARRDESKPNWHLQVDEIHGNSLGIVFFNPSESGTSGLTRPVGLLSRGDDIFRFMFQMDKLPENDCFRLTYEFYHRTYSKIENEVEKS